MSSSSLFCLSITLLVLILTVESVYYAYSYDNDNDNDNEEHCCLVRIRENICVARPITRSLVQVNKQCHRFDRSQRHRSGRKNRNDKYLDKILSRLNVQTSQEVGDKILIELKNPLEKKILEKDLICLKSTNKNMNFDKCYVEIVDELDTNNDDDDDSDDDDDHHHHHHRHRMSHGTHKCREHGHRRCQHRHHYDRKKRADDKHEQKEDNPINDKKNTKENEAKKESNQIELDQPVRIHEGHGFSIRQTYKIKPNDIRPINRQQRQCLSWYRKQTRKIRHNSSKYQKSCINLYDRSEKCINQLVYNTFNTNETINNQQQEYTKNSFPIGSKLYCENQAGYNRLIGYYHYKEVCFYADDQITIEHKFTDITGLSDMEKNKETLEFIARSKKLTAEFEDDCHDTTTLVEIAELEKSTIKKLS
ncbi:unnamed protein product [Rotaria sp. Silwood2]|nr:unnamed protein product [Rotaria sp. Silwood2]CAF2506275.1 unnamed protein product [Rotaria sp. Silwood2]CAF2905443.1 unnamed protein product [Rotaria sp. Silwood2]CAF3918772.1 unnamed protein product [Rotaria sp. Silwood2]CAF4019985.1 unnamed protein product [Rotaria sp. Silwood2]